MLPKIKTLLTSRAWLFAAIGSASDGVSGVVMAYFQTKWQEVFFEIPAATATYGSGILAFCKLVIEPYKLI